MNKDKKDKFVTLKCGVTVNDKYLSAPKKEKEFIISGDFVIDANGDLNSYLNQSNCSDTDLKHFKGYEKELNSKPLRR